MLVRHVFFTRFYSTPLSSSDHTAHPKVCDTFVSADNMFVDFDSSRRVVKLFIRVIFFITTILFIKYIFYTFTRVLFAI